MSTRCNVLVKDSKGDELWYYRHSDGYPESVLPSLQPLIDKVNDGSLRGNIVQFTGWIIKQGIDEYKNVNWEWKVGAYEPTTCQHGDVEWLYTITLDENQKATLEHKHV